MNRITRALVVAGAVASAIGATRADAQVLETMKFETSFPFTVEQMNFPAGKYTVRPLEMDHYVLEISNGSMTKLLEVEPAGVPFHASRRAAPDDEVVFAKRGDVYVLTEIWDSAEQTGVEPIPAANQIKPAANAQPHHHHHDHAA